MHSDGVRRDVAPADAAATAANMWTAFGGRKEYFARFGPKSLSPAESRRFVTESLHSAGYDDEALVHRVTLATNELVTNAVTHAKTDLEVRVTPEAGAVYAEVVDSAREGPCPLATTVDDVSGRGLMIVDAVVDEWGVASLPGGPGKRVWVRVASPPSPDS